MDNNELYASMFSLILILALPIFIYYKFTNIKNPPLPPGPWGLPIVGYLPFLRGRLHHQLAELGHHYGPIFRFRLGYKPYIIINSPSLAKEVVRDHDVVFANRYVTIAANIASYGAIGIAWGRYSSMWQSLRKLFVQDMLSSSSLEASRILRTVEVRKAIKSIYSENQKPVDLRELSFTVELNVIMSMLWGGIDDGEEGERVRMEFRRLVPGVVDISMEPNVSDLFPILACLDIQGVKKQAESIMMSFDKIMDAVIKKHKDKSCIEKEMEIGKKDFLQFLLEHKSKGDTKFSVNDEQIKALITEILVAGTDTTSTTMEWVMAELINNPEVMKKVHKELSDVVGINNIVEEFHAPKLQYLLAVLKETMRLHPVGPLLIPRSPSKSTAIGGYIVPKNSVVFINVWSIHTNPSIWDSPFEFNPTRFLGDREKLDFSGNNFNYMPFGSGRRICPGRPLAEKMLVYLLASLIHSFDWNLPEGETLDMEDKYVVMLRKKIPLVAIPSPRLSNMSLYEI